MTNFFDNILTNSLDVSDESLVKSCLDRFDLDKDGALNVKEFNLLTDELFKDAAGKPYTIPVHMRGDMFFALNLKKDGLIDASEFNSLWKRWITPIIKPCTALIVIDVQNDFIDGSLAIRNCPAKQEGYDVVPVINNLLNSVPFNYTFYSYDWHPKDHISFIDNVHLRKFHAKSLVTVKDAKVFDTVIFEGPPEIEQKLWPTHCVQNSFGSQLHPKLQTKDDSIFIYKGTSSDIDSYSAFWDNEKRSQTNLAEELDVRKVTDVYICGLAYDYCVGFTTLHALEHGYRTVLIEDACKGVSLEDINKMRDRIMNQNGIVVSSDKVKNMVIGYDRRPELGYRTAMTLCNLKN